jgi:hypothetical protein
MPVTKALPYEWYDTPNIRVGTFADFEVLARADGLRVTDSFGLHDGRRHAPLAQPARQRGGVPVRARPAGELHEALDPSLRAALQHRLAAWPVQGHDPTKAQRRAAVVLAVVEEGHGAEATRRGACWRSGAPRRRCC